MEIELGSTTDRPPRINDPRRMETGAFAATRYESRIRKFDLFAFPMQPFEFMTNLWS